MKNMAFDINNFVIDKVTRIVAVDASNNMLWMANQIEDPSLQCDGEEVLKKDADGTTIASFSNAKSAKFAAASSLFDLNLLAAQFGTTKTVASAGATIVAPRFEMRTVTASEATANAIVLDKTVINSGTVGTPVYKITVALLTKDGALKKSFAQGASVAAGKFAYTANTKTVTFNSGDIVEGDSMFVEYEYETENCVSVVNSASNFPVANKVYAQVKGFDICNQSTVYFGYLVLPNAKLSTSATINLGREDSFPFEMTCAQDYCSTDKELFKIVVPQ
jgi:hypothetical protein